MKVYTRQIITWGGSWYKIASARVPACACEGVRACTSSLRACTASAAQGGRVHSSGTSSTSLWSIHTRMSRQCLHMCHVASWTVRETLCSVPLCLHILEVLVRYTCIARVRFGNQIMNKYHTIACKLWVIYASCRPSFNSYSSSHSKSISFYKKPRASLIRRISKTREYEEHGIRVECPLESYMIVWVFDCA